MRWKRKANAPEEAPPPEPAPGDLTEPALDTIAALLRVYGRYAFDLTEVSADQIKDRCEEWARHVLVGSNRVALSDDDDGAPVPRDWASVRSFYTEHRQAEKEYVATTLDDFRDLIWAFVQGLSRVVVQDQRSDGSVRSKLQRLEAAINGNSPQELKREARDAVGLIQRIIEERQDRHRQQLEELGARLEAMRGELAEARKRMTVDSLTGLYNRAAFDEQIGRVGDLATFFMKPAWLFMLDIDHFKWVNDKFGHPTGDQVLQEVGVCIRDCFKRREDFAARYGGEEFAVLIQEATPEIAELLVERLMNSIRDLEIPVSDETVRVTISVGVARFQPGDDPTGWIDRADRALYSAKNAGRDRSRTAE